MWAGCPRDDVKWRRAAPAVAPASLDELAGAGAGERVLVVGGERAYPDAAEVLVCDPAGPRPMGWQALDPHRHGLFHLTLCQRLLSSEPDPLGMLLALRRATFDGGRLVVLTRLGAGVGFDGGWTFDAATASGLLAASGWNVTGAFEVEGRHAFTASTAAVSAWLEAAQHPRSEANNRFPVGHYYSPLPDHTELAAEPRRSQVWPPRPRATPGVDWRDDAQVRLCREIFAAQERLEFPATSSDPAEFFTDNDQYPALDAWLLEAVLRHLRPRRMIEVGSGLLLAGLGAREPRVPGRRDGLHLHRALPAAVPARGRARGGRAAGGEDPGHAAVGLRRAGRR